MQPAKESPAVTEAAIVESLGALDDACQALLVLAARVREQIEPFRGNPLVDELWRSLDAAPLFTTGCPGHIQLRSRAARVIAAVG